MINGQIREWNHSNNALLRRTVKWWRAACGERQRRLLFSSACLSCFTLFCFVEKFLEEYLFPVHPFISPFPPVPTPPFSLKFLISLSLLLSYMHFTFIYKYTYKLLSLFSVAYTYRWCMCLGLSIWGWLLMGELVTPSLSMQLFTLVDGAFWDFSPPLLACQLLLLFVWVLFGDYSVKVLWVQLLCHLQKTPSHSRHILSLVHTVFQHHLLQYSQSLGGRSFVVGMSTGVGHPVVSCALHFWTIMNFCDGLLCFTSDTSYMWLSSDISPPAGTEWKPYNGAQYWQSLSWVSFIFQGEGFSPIQLLRPTSDPPHTVGTHSFCPAWLQKLRCLSSIIILFNVFSGAAHEA